MLPLPYFFVGAAPLSVNARIHRKGKGRADDRAYEERRTTDAKHPERNRRRCSFRRTLRLRPQPHDLEVSEGAFTPPHLAVHPVPANQQCRNGCRRALSDRQDTSLKPLFRSDYLVLDGIDLDLKTRLVRPATAKLQPSAPLMVAACARAMRLIEEETCERRTSQQSLPLRRSLRPRQLGAMPCCHY